MSKLNENRPGYKKTKIGWIPEEWECVRLSLIVNGLHAGVSVNSYDDKAQGSELGVLKTSAVTYGYFNSEQNKRIRENEIYRARISPIAGSIIISRMNTKELVGANAFVEKNFPTLRLPDRLWQMKVKDKNINNPRWLGYLMASQQLRSKLSSLATGTSGSMKNITQQDVLTSRIPLPPLPEQKKIAEILSSWDRAIEHIGTIIKAKEKRFKGLIQKLIGKHCNNWEHLKGNKIFDSISEKNYPDEELLSVTQDRGVIPRTMLEGKVMSPEGSTAMYKLIKKGDFVISLRSFQGGIEYSNYQGIISPAYTVLRPKIELYNDFYRHFFKTYLFIEKYLRIAVIGIRDGKQISIPDFMTVKIPYPPLEQQKEIAETLSIAQREIDVLKNLVEVYRKQKRGLMQKLLTGNIRVKTA